MKKIGTKQRIGILLVVLLVWSFVGLASKDYTAKNQTITWTGTTNATGDSSMMMDTVFLLDPVGYNAGMITLTLSGPISGGGVTNGGGLEDSGYIVVLREIHYTDSTTDFIRIDSIGPQSLVDTFMIYTKDMHAAVGDTFLSGPLWAELLVHDTVSDSAFQMTYGLHKNWHLK